MARPALSDADRDLRRRHLLDTARRLYRERGALPLVADIAASAGLAKGTVYLYFKTKEEIFVALLEDYFDGLYAAMDSLLPALPVAGAAAARQFAAAYCALLRHDSGLLPLAVMGNTVLEKNLPLQAMLQFKTRLAQGLTRAGALLDARVAPPGEQRGAALLLQTYGLTIGLWQALDYPAALSDIIAQHGALAILKRDFYQELEQAVERLWRAALLESAAPPGKVADDPA